jgi:hypothetical protein
MTVYKRANSDFVITNKNTYLANTTIATHTLFVDGNLLVGGNTTMVYKTDMNVTDNMIVLNSGETGSGVTLDYAGIEVDRGLLANTALRWNEIVDRWQISIDGITYGNLVTSSGSGAFQIEIDTAPILGGPLQTNAYPILSGNSYPVAFDSNLAVKYTTTAPDTVAGYDVIYAQTPGTGGSGLYVTNTTIQNKELATQRRSIVYSLVL